MIYKKNKSLKIKKQKLINENDETFQIFQSIKNKKMNSKIFPPLI